MSHAPVIEALIDIEYRGYVAAECHRSTGGTLTDIDIARHELTTLGELVDDAAD